MTQLKKLYKDEHYIVGFYDGDEIYKTPHEFRTEEEAIALWEMLKEDAPEYKWTIFTDGHFGYNKKTGGYEYKPTAEAWLSVDNRTKGEVRF